MQNEPTATNVEPTQPEAVEPWAPPAEGLDIHHYLGILWHRKWLMLAVFAVIFSLAAIRTYRTSPLFQAAATLMFEQTEREELLKLYPQPLYYQDSRIANQIEILKSRQMRDRVAASVPDSLVPYAKMVDPTDTTTIHARQLVRWIAMTAEPIKDTDLIAIMVTSPSPVLSTAFANLYVDVFQREDLDQGRKDVSAMRRFIEEQLSVVGRRLDLAEIGLEEFKKEQRFIDLSTETSALIGQQSNLAALLATTSTEQEGIQARLVYIRSQIDEESAGMSGKLESISSPMLVNFKAQLDQSEVERANLLMQGYTDESAKIQLLNRQIGDIRAKLALESKRLLESGGIIEPVGRLRSLWESALELEIDLTSVNARKSIVEAALTDLRAKLRNLPEVERTYAKLTRDVEADRAVYAMLSQRYEDARIQEAGRVSPIRVVDKAAYASQVRPIIQRDLSLAAIIGAVIALVVGFGVDFLDTTIRGPEDAEKRGLPVLANVPVLPGKSRWGKNPITSHLVTHAEPSSSGAEAFRVLRTNLLFSAAGSPCAVIAVTSAEPGEGKSTATVNLGATLAQAGNRTLLVDCDLRAPVLHSVFEHARKPGFSDVVVFGMSPREVLFATSVENLFCMTSGTIPPSPSDILSSSKATKVLEEMRKDFDFILIDTPPALLSADTSIIAAKADGVIFIVRPGATSRPALDNALRHLLQSGSRIIGCVMNGLRPSGRYGAYYYYYYSGYDYKYHYSRRRKSLEEKTDEGVVV
ncbi:MAG: polysaccharide biosynthesis tyrosine autokinase [Candidatus Eisenbacteria bacterium]|jgi:tyrosine-protein kinase Etk/Wzc|nr:polysaccharide biosynthesis tyrosine autokinase [Candidatus Eisenbacteria bacterium]